MLPRLYAAVMVVCASRIGAAAAATPADYFTSFDVSETPLSESGAWSSIDATRTRMATSAGRCFGTQVGGAYDDSVALLSGAWPPDVQLTGTVFRGTTSGIEEVELLLRFAQTTTSSTGYEINFAHDGQYVNLYRWEGGINLADFVPLVPENTHGIAGGLHSGDQVRAKIQGDTITAYYNKGSGWVEIFSASDTSNGGHARYAVGQPGIGAFKTGGSGALNQFAFDDLRVIADSVFANGFE